MPTDKELADAYRLVLADNKSIILTSVATRRIDELDPPKPPIVVDRFEVAHMGPNDTTAKFMREAADRADMLGHGSNVTHTVRQVLRGYADALDAADGERTPVRVLADDETPVKLDPDMLPEDVDFLIHNLSACGGPHVVTRDILSAVRDALDAEAGDRP